MLATLRMLDPGFGGGHILGVRLLLCFWAFLGINEASAIRYHLCYHLLSSVGLCACAIVDDNLCFVGFLAPMRPLMAVIICVIIRYHLLSSFGGLGPPKDDRR